MDNFNRIVLSFILICVFMLLLIHERRIDKINEKIQQMEKK